MRLFQNSALYPAYMPRLRWLTEGCDSFASRIGAFLDDRFGAPHFLLPILAHDPSSFFTNCNDEVLQRRWAFEQGLAGDTSLDDILLAQIEHHRTEVFYNMDPLRYGSPFVRRLPACVKSRIAWRAAPSQGADFAAYDRVVCNFPSILDSYRERGWRAAYFAPAHDPEMDAYAANTDRPIDVIFVGGYSRHHRQRAEILEAVAGQRKGANIAFHLDRSRLTKLAESLPGRLLPLGRHRRPPQIRAVSAEPLFGRSLYQALSQAKLVLNGAVDMAGADRGNMRCFEAMGCGCVLLSDEGNYPDGMQAGQNLLTYASSSDAILRLQEALASPMKLEAIARKGHDMVALRYSKLIQWERFRALAQ